MKKAILTFAFVLSILAIPTVALASDPSVRAGKYAVTLRMPEDGIFADEETELEFRIVDASAEDPVLGAPGVIRAEATVSFTMPSMPGMPKQEETAHAEGVPGEYGVHPIFPHGGEYLMRIAVKPPEGEPFTVEFPLAVKDADPTRPPRPKPFFVDLTSKPGKPAAGEPVELKFAIRDREEKKVVKEFDIAHERIFHLMIVRKDLGEFAHEHPEQERDGTFKLKFTFPTEGTYHLFADLAPRGRGSQVLLATIDVKGSKKAPKPVAFALAPGAPKPFTGDGIRATLSSDPAQPLARGSNTLTVTLVDEKTGAPVTDLQPYLGAMGHMVLVHEDGVTYVHSHPDESDPKIGKNGVVPFLARFAKPGLYRCWAQFQRDGKIITTSYMVEVKEAR